MLKRKTSSLVSCFYFKCTLSCSNKKKKDLSVAELFVKKENFQFTNLMQAQGSYVFRHLLLGGFSEKIMLKVMHCLLCMLAFFSKMDLRLFQW